MVDGLVLTLSFISVRMTEHQLLRRMAKRTPRVRDMMETSPSKHPRSPILKARRNRKQEGGSEVISVDEHKGSD